MAHPTNPASSWRSQRGTPRRLFGTGADEYELYERDGEFVLSVELPGYDPADIEVGWDDGRLTVKRGGSPRLQSWEEADNHPRSAIHSPTDSP